MIAHGISCSSVGVESAQHLEYRTCPVSVTSRCLEYRTCPESVTRYELCNGQKTVFVVMFLCFFVLQFSGLTDEAREEAKVLGELLWAMIKRAACAAKEAEYKREDLRRMAAREASAAKVKAAAAAAGVASLSVEGSEDSQKLHSGEGVPAGPTFKQPVSGSSASDAGPVSGHGPVYKLIDVEKERQKKEAEREYELLIDELQMMANKVIIVNVPLNQAPWVEVEHCG
jgi:hypothetical protein